MLRTKGFTLIELLIVIAIIGILVAVILPNLNNARSGGQDATVREDLFSLRSQADLYSSDNNNTYTGMFGGSGAWTSPDSSVQAILDGISGQDPGGAMFANSTDSTWVATAELPSTLASTTPAYWCVDNTGVSAQWGGASAPDATVAACQ